MARPRCGALASYSIWRKSVASEMLMRDSRLACPPSEAASYPLFLLFLLRGFVLRGQQSEDLQLLVARHENLAVGHYRNQVRVVANVLPGPGGTLEKHRHGASAGIRIERIKRYLRLTDRQRARKRPDDGIGRPVRGDGREETGVLAAA